ncbi:CCE_0567 family metalloprotein, partial [Mesorhizobium sp. PL10]
MNLNATDANSDRRRGYFSASLDDDLRDLAKDLPVGWRRIRAVAEKTFDVFCRVGRQGENSQPGRIHDDQPVRYPRRLQMDARLSD